MVEEVETLKIELMVYVPDTPNSDVKTGVDITIDGNRKNVIQLLRFLRKNFTTKEELATSRI